MPEEKLIPVKIEEVERKLLDTGLMYAINQLILHPLGMALSLSFEENGLVPLNIMLMETEHGGHIEFDEETRAKGAKKLLDFMNQSRPNQRLLIEATFASDVEET